MEVLGVSTSARFHPDETESTGALPLDPAAFLKKAGENFQLICSSPFGTVARISLQNRWR